MRAARGALSSAPVRAVLISVLLIASAAAHADMSQIMPSASPTNRRSTGIATEHFTASSDDRFWIFGGFVNQGNGSEISETWNYSTVTNTWVQVTPTATPQGTRERHALSFEPL